MIDLNAGNQEKTKIKKYSLRRYVLNNESRGSGELARCPQFSMNVCGPEVHRSHVKARVWQPACNLC